MTLTNLGLAICGLGLSFIGSAILREQPIHYTPAKARGLFFLLLGLAFLFMVRWWLTIVGFLVSPIVFGILNGRSLARHGREAHPHAWSKDPEA
ncbi:MAG TPA: hypothetical protein VFW62_07080 [bacterium]|nr:hypothetical protein [bacterium]